MSMQWRRRTSLCDFREGQARASLQVDIFGVNQGAQSSERLAVEEVGLRALCVGNDPGQ